VNRSVPDRKNQIVSTASRLFGEHGFDSVTIKQLAGACAVTESALYRHFDSKEAIYEAVLDSVKDRLRCRELFENLEDERDIETLLTRLAQHVIAFFTEHADLYRLLLYSTLHGHGKAKQVYGIIRGAYAEFLRQQLDRLFRHGHIIKKNNDVTARCFVGMVFDCSLATTLWKDFQGPIYKPADIIANNVPIYVRGLKSTNPTSKGKDE
jgi:AcrR family transcriptional regulator